MAEVNCAELEAVLGHRFRAFAHLDRALTHSSYKSEVLETETGSNERLEFLGDAILGFLASEFLITEYAAWDEGKLSTAKARLVSARQLAAAATRLGLGQFLKLGRGEEKTGVRENPSVLADMYEAILAAIYLDAGIEVARDFVRRTLLNPALSEEAEFLEQPDHKSALQGFLQALGMRLAEYRHVKEYGPDHRKIFAVEAWVDGKLMASAEGSTKKEAEQAAAGATLEKLQANQIVS
ncbi:MAG: ribonuclease III [Acidobacteria bacterium]|nr:ribonuclease III [Acidobacteriota bacterium]